MSEIDYHIYELEVARTPNDPRRVMPTLPDRCQSVLDVGCGAGQTLIACELKSGIFACGVDLDEEALALGRRMSQHIQFICAQGERLPFTDQSFDIVISRVALPYMHIPNALDEIARVLKPGGHAWFTLYPSSIIIHRISAAIRAGNIKNLLFQFYIVVNSLYFHITGRQFQFPFNRRRCESIQTVSAITRAMRRVGFDSVRMDRDRFFVVTAIKGEQISTIGASELCAVSAASPYQDN